jgi:hypothetical protein
MCGITLGPELLQVLDVDWTSELVFLSGGASGVSIGVAKPIEKGEYPVT